MAKVLVIDDCQAFRDRARFAFQTEGLIVLEARDALAGLQRAVEDAPDLILVAHGLPGLGGVEVCERIAGDPASRQIPILMTSDTGADVAEPGDAAGRAVIARSIAAWELAEVVRGLLRPASHPSPFGLLLGNSSAPSPVG